MSSGLAKKLKFSALVGASASLLASPSTSANFATNAPGTLNNEVSMGWNSAHSYSF